MQKFIYTLKETPLVKNEVSVIGVIDGSGSMTAHWDDLCKAWNYFISESKSSFCIQFDDTAILQESPQLSIQKGEDTNIELGFSELSKLIKSGRVSKDVAIVFITDGVGKEDKVENFIDELKVDFEKFGKDGYQFKFWTLAVGEEFSHSIVAELKNCIHNSNVISSQLEYITNPKTDFTRKLQEIKEEKFYQMVKVDPGVQLTPFTKQVTRIACNQTIYTTVSQIKVNGKIVDLEKKDTTFQSLDRFVKQILAKLMEENSRGVDIKQEAINSLQIIEYFKQKVVSGNDDVENMKIIDNNICQIELFATGDLSIYSLEPKKAAEFINQLQNTIIRIKKKEPIKRQSVLHQQIGSQQVFNIYIYIKGIIVKDHYKEMSNNRLKEYEQIIKNDDLLKELLEFVNINRGKTLEQMVFITRSHDFQNKSIREFIQNEEDTALDMMDLYMICLD